MAPNKRVNTSRNPAGRKIQETPEEKIRDWNNKELSAKKTAYSAAEQKTINEPTRRFDIITFDIRVQKNRIFLYKTY